MNNKYIIEEMPDLSTDSKNNPYATKFRNEMLRYFSNNIVLENGQMISIDLPKELEITINEYLMGIFTNILRSENLIADCKKIVDEYKNTSKNNSNSFIKNCYEVITNMDKANKMVWNICQKLNDGVGSYDSYIKWQKDKINVDKEIYDDWTIIYNVRNEIEHPKELLSASLLRKVSNNKIELPSIDWDGKKYDLFSMARQSIEIVSIFARLVIGASYLYSKYTLVLTDETRTSLFINKD